MNVQYLERIPKWYQDNDKKNLVLSDDIDSLVTTMILKQVKNWEIGYFYDFDYIYITPELIEEKDKMHTRVWCDTAVVRQEMCFDNHVSRKSAKDILNDKCINPNIINNVTAQNYTDKYAGSTALMVWSLYDLPLPKTEEGKMLLLAIDAAYAGFYRNFKETNRFYLCDMFGFEELYELQKRHDIKDFYQIIDKYSLMRKISRMLDGKLTINMDLKVIGDLLGLPLELPEGKYQPWHRFVQNTKKSNTFCYAKDISPRLFTLAFTYRDAVKYSIAVK